MKRMTRLLLILALIAITTPSNPAPSHARAAAASLASPAAAGAPTAESVVGAAARFGCRQGFRYIGTPFFVMFGGFCLLALLYIF
jgi:hypothetical protein